MNPNAASAALEGRYAALLGAAAGMTSDELLDVVEDAQREINAASARQAVALAHLSAIDPVRQEDGTLAEVHHGVGHQRMDAPELAAPRLGISTRAASNRVSDAIRQLTRTPAVVDAMAAGDLDERRAAVVTEETECLSAEDAATVVDDVAQHWAYLTVGPLRRLVARTAARVAPDAVAKEAERARERRGLTRRLGEHGLDQWRADVLAEESGAAWAAVTERARQLVRDGEAENLTQARADALMRLVLDHSDVRVVIHTTRAAGEPEPPQGTPRPSTEADPDGWVEIGGLAGAGTSFVPASFLKDATVGGQLRCHPVTGALLDGDVPAGLAVGRDLKGTSTKETPAYRIPAAMVRFVRLRDGACRFPGCVMPARQCDLDHVRPWPLGRTHPGNLMALCRHHHRVKQRDGWTVRLHEDRTVTWTDPSGRTHTTLPVDHLHHATASGSPNAGHRTPSRRSPRTRHVDISLLEDQWTELLDAETRHRPPTRRRTRHDDWWREPWTVHVDHHWLGLGFDPPPREPQPDVIPF